MAKRPITIILNPVSLPAGEHSTITPRPGEIAGLKVAFVDNTKPNFNVFCDRVEELLLSDYGVAEVKRYRKPGRTVGVSAEIVAEVKADSDFVIAGLGD